MSAPAPAPSVAAGPQIQEVHTDDEDGSSTTSDGYNANLMMSTAESMEPAFYDHHGCDLADPMDNLANVVGNLVRGEGNGAVGEKEWPPLSPELVQDITVPLVLAWCSLCLAPEPAAEQQQQQQQVWAEE